MKNIVSYGGGTQSTAMILMALEGKFNLPRPDFGVYADTGGEPEFINEYVRYFIDYVKQKYDFDIFIVGNHIGLADNLMQKPRISKNNNPYIPSIPPFFVLNQDGSKGMIQRQCTHDYKILPIKRFLKNKLDNNEPYIKWFGISFDERSRMKISTEKKCTNYYPLVENYISRINSINYIKKMGVKPAQRSACYFCPFHSDRYWQWLKDYHHAEFIKAVKLEHKFQDNTNSFRKTKMTYFLHRSCKPLDQVQFTDEDQLNMFPELIDECGGECGI